MKKRVPKKRPQKVTHSSFELINQYKKCKRVVRSAPRSGTARKPSSTNRSPGRTPRCVVVFCACSGGASSFVSSSSIRFFLASEEIVPRSTKISRIVFPIRNDERRFVLVNDDDQQQQQQQQQQQPKIVVFARVFGVVSERDTNAVFGRLKSLLNFFGGFWCLFESTFVQKRKN